MNKPTQKSVGHRGMIIRLFICILAAAITVYAYIVKQNDVTELRLAIPAVAKELRQINDENIRLQYEIDQFESPIHLMELSRKPEFSHLKYPYVKDIVTVPEKNESKNFEQKEK